MSEEIHFARLASRVTVFRAAEAQIQAVINLNRQKQGHKATRLTANYQSTLKLLSMFNTFFIFKCKSSSKFPAFYFVLKEIKQAVALTDPDSLSRQQRCKIYRLIFIKNVKNVLLYLSPNYVTEH